MAQLSFPWPDTTDPGPQIGDGRPYTSAEWDQYFEAVFTAMGGATEGVLPRVWNELTVTTPGANQIDVDTGMGFVKGKFYPSNAVENLAPPSAGAGSARKDSVILRCDWTGGVGEQYTVRVAIKQGDVTNYPTMTQTDNTVWEIELYRYIINDSGAISDLTDKRVYCHFATEIIEAMLAAALSAKLVTGGDAHDHEDGEGAALGPGAITDRIRTFFIPVVAGYDETTGQILTNFDFMGLELVDDHECWAYGWWQVPKDFVSGLTVTAVVIAYLNGNIYSENRTRYGKCGELHNVHTANTGLAAEACVANENTCVATTSIAGAEVGDIVRITYTRLAQSALDTIEDHAKVAGWIAQCTMDS